MSSGQKPWTVKGVPWKTEAAFYGWVRGQLRRGWSRHPVKNQYLQSLRFKKQNTKGRAVWHITCELCKEDNVMANIEVDHIIPSGKFTSVSDIEGFVHRLYWVTFDTIQCLCKECHRNVTYAQSKGISVEEAKFARLVIQVMKLPVKGLKGWMKKRNLQYITPKPENESIIREYLKGENK